MLDIRFTLAIFHVFVEDCKDLRVEDLEASDSVDHTFEVLEV